MSAKLTIARPEDADRLLRLVAACHAETGIEMPEEDRAVAVAELLGGTVQGVAYLIGPPSSPVGYVTLSFGYSISFGGIEGHVDEIYVRPQVRRRGMASEAMAALAKALPAHGVKALRASCDADDRLFTRRLRFQPAGRERNLIRRL